MVKFSFLKKIRSLLGSKHFFHKSTNGAPPTGKVRRFWHFSKLEKAVLAITITAILLVSALGILINANQQQSIVVQPQNYNPTTTPSPTPEDSSSPTVNPTTTSIPTSPPAPRPYIPTAIGPQAPVKGPIESDPSMSNTTWLTIAQDAWSFYQPGRGVDSTTGLPASSVGWNHFTDWDLGVYIQAIIDAQKIGLISTGGDWGSHARLEKVVSWLETRPLVNGSIPYWFYNSDGTGYTSGPSIDTVDAGTLLAALSNLKAFDSSFSSRIDTFVYNRNNNRTDYASLVPSLQNEAGSTSIYGYYMIKGFASFWPNQLGAIPNQILNNIRNAGTVSTYNVTLPKASLLCEPLLYGVFNLNTTGSENNNLAWLMNVTYSAHEAKYNATGQYSAFSEGISSAGFVWEWVVTPSGDTWIVTASGGIYPNINPVIYNKVAISFLALYNTSFAYNMSVYLEKLSPDPSTGYCAGADYNQNINLATVYPSVDSNTNGLILCAARYALHA